jgi:acetyl-CoA C-acetyltransferase
VHALHTHGKARGLATLCHGVGGATAVAVEMV